MASRKFSRKGSTEILQTLSEFKEIDSIIYDLWETLSDTSFN